MCQFAYEKKMDMVCVNPFHYERIVQGSGGFLIDNGLTVRYLGARKTKLID